MQNLKRLDIRLAELYKDFSRGFYQKLIWKGGIKINGKIVVKSHHLVCEDDKIDIDEKIKKSLLEITEELVPDHKFLFLDKDMAVIDKPPFVRTESLVKGFLPVHRLDKNTSGILVAAKGPQAQARLQAQFKERRIKKTYLALVRGELVPLEGAIEGGIFRSMRDRRKMAVSALPKARAAYTKYKIIGYFEAPLLCEKFTLAKVFPETGRTHQIRVHFASIGYPVIGDELYGDKKLNKKIEQHAGLNRQFLHAEQLILSHPATGKKLTFTSKLPEDLQKALGALSKIRP